MGSVKSAGSFKSDVCFEFTILAKDIASVQSDVSFKDTGLAVMLEMSSCALVPCSAPSDCALEDRCADS